MSLAGFAFLIAFIGALAVFSVIIALMIYAVRKVGIKGNADETYENLKKIDFTFDVKSRAFIGFIKYGFRIGKGLFWGGLIVGIVAAIVGA